MRFLELSYRAAPSEQARSADLRKVLLTLFLLLLIVFQFALIIWIAH
jgi:hypothetical protein